MNMTQHRRQDLNGPTSLFRFAESCVDMDAWCSMWAEGVRWCGSGRQSELVAVSMNT